MAPCEFYRELAAAEQRREDTFNRDTVLAWRIVDIWAHTKSKGRVPKLKSLLSSPGGTKRQSAKAMGSVLQVLSEQYGIPLRRKGKVVPLRTRRPKALPKARLKGRRKELK